MRDTKWLRLRRKLGPITRRVPYGHLITGAATYGRLLVPGLPRPSRRFVIFAQGRSGSTLLADLLNSHPQLYCADEILTWKRRNPSRYANACSVGHRADTYGFKVKIYQLTEAQQLDQPGLLLQQLHEQGWLLLHLHRRNVLRQALSSMVAAQRHVYHQPLGSGLLPPVPVDPGELLRQTADRERYCQQEALALEGLPFEPFVYEDDLLRPESHQAAASRAFAYLGITDVPVRTQLRKIADRPLKDAVANHQEVFAAVAASPYAHLLQQE